MAYSPRIQSLLSAECNGLFELSLNTDDMSLVMIMTAKEIRKLLEYIEEQLVLLEEA